jgi:hypothetical protein
MADFCLAKKRLRSKQDNDERNTVGNTLQSRRSLGRVKQAATRHRDAGKGVPCIIPLLAGLPVKKAAKTAEKRGDNDRIQASITTFACRFLAFRTRDATAYRAKRH